MGKKREVTTLPTLTEPEKYTPEEKAKIKALTEDHKARVAELESGHAAVQDQIAHMNPDEQAAVLEMQDIVNSCIDEENDYFSDEAFAQSKRNNEADKAGSNEPVGKIFSYKGNLLIKTPFHTTIPAQVYVDVLQDNILGVTNELTDLKAYNLELLAKLESYGDPFASGNLGFWALVRVAFKRLFRRG
jgi:hypothetical protein